MSNKSQEHEDFDGAKKKADKPILEKIEKSKIAPSKRPF